MISIGLSVSRDNHERYGYELILKDKDLEDAYKDDFQLILEAVREHRASTGRPKSIVAKIVSDADKIGHTTSRVLNRAYGWECMKFPNLDHEEKLLRSATHLREKFGDNGIGSRLYFDESKKRLEEIFSPIFKSLEDLEKLNRILESDI